MRWLCSALVLVLCLHCLQSKHIKHHNFDGDSEQWLSGPDLRTGQPQHHKYHHRNIWNNFETTANLAKPSSTQFPPYYLSYDSGIKTSYQAIEEKLIDDQDRLNEERFRINQEYLATIENQDTSGDAPIQLPESQVKEAVPVPGEHISKPIEQALSQQVTEIASPTPAANRQVGRRGMDGTFGFMVGQHFYPCDKPKYFDKDGGVDRLPDSYYYRCQYWDTDPRHQYERKVGKLGRKGYFGYFNEGRFIECPPPAHLDQDQDDPNLFYIPLDSGYDSRCQYYGYNVSKLFSWSDDPRAGHSAHLTGDVGSLFTAVALILGLSLSLSLA